MSADEPQYLAFSPEEEVPPHLRAQGEQAGAALESLVCDLVNQEAMRHLRFAHDCNESCYSEGLVEFVMDRIPESQARFMTMQSVKMVASVYLADNPHLIG